ncbi:MAG: DUF2127 domain-containing protein [Actinobacteria bacterium]|nr:DUF2127 domain-containing protein [Actinomycetota bacterium]
MDWDLRTCSRKGHLTYAADEPQFRVRLEASTPMGEAWRCLRCGAYVLGPPSDSGPAADAPVLLRGKALRSAFILRLLAIERWVRGIIIILLGIAVWRFRSTQVSLKQLFNRDLSALQPFFRQINFNVSDSGTIRAIDNALNARESTLTVVAVGLLGYGALQVLEGIGLWSLRRWGEYVAVVGTSIFLPLEIYELTEKITALRVIAFVVNVAAVVYLVVSKRLFGVRGGGAAYERAQHEASLLEVEQSSGTPGSGSDAQAPASGRDAPGAPETGVRDSDLTAPPDRSGSHGAPAPAPGSGHSRP